MEDKEKILTTENKKADANNEPEIKKQPVNNAAPTFDAEKIKKDKKKGKLSLGAMFEEIETYGFNYSFKSFLGQLLIVFAIMGIAAYFYELKFWAVLLLIIACSIATPFMIKSQFKYKFENSKFDDAGDYLQQMTTSFLKTKKIRDSLAETSLVLSGRRIQAFIDEAISIIDNKQSSTLYEDAFAVIEKEYGCDKMDALHSFLIKIEAEGGDFEDTLNLMINDNQSWVEMTYKYQGKRKGVQSGILMGIVMSLVMCGILNMFIPKEIDTGNHGKNLAANKYVYVDTKSDTAYDYQNITSENDATVSFNKDSSVIIDLGGTYTVKSIDVNWGKIPEKAVVYVSPNRKDWEKACEIKELYADENNYVRFEEPINGKYVKIESIAGDTPYDIEYIEAHQFDPKNLGYVSLSISDYFAYQIASVFFLIIMVVIYTMSQTLMQGSWLDDKGVRKTKDIVKDYRYYKNFDLKQERIKYALWAVIMVVLAVVIIKFFNQPYLGVIVLGCALYYLTMPKRKLKNTKKRLTTDIQKAFPGWVRDISISLNTQTVQNAIIISEPKTPTVMKPAVNQLIKEFTEDPVSYLPWSRFLSDFDVPEIKTAARMFYSINELSGDSAKEQINVLIRRNSKSVMEADEKKADDAVSALGFAVMLPMGVSIIKLIVDLVCLMLRFMSVTGQIGGM